MVIFLSRVTNDVDAIANTLNQSVASLVSSVTLFLGSLFMMFKTNWIMAKWDPFHIVGLCLWLYYVKITKIFYQQQEYLGNEWSY